MKQIQLFKKRLSAIVLVFGVCAIGFSSCKKDDTSSSSTTDITETDAAEASADAITPSSGGMVDQVNNSITLAQSYSASSYCGAQKDTVIAHASASDATVVFSYSLHWSWVMTCSILNTPQKFDFNFNGNSNYNGPNMTSTDNSNSTVSITGFENTSSSYTYNQTYTRQGNLTSKIGRQNNFTSNIAITSTNIIIDKSTKKITSGTATVTISGASSSGKAFTYNGTITFNGNNTASMVLNSGVTYKIQW